MRKLFFTLCLFCLSLPFKTHAQTVSTASGAMQAGTWAVRVPYNISDSGTEYTFSFGMGGWSWDFFAYAQRNHCGTNNLKVARIGFVGRFDASYTALTDAQKTSIDNEINNTSQTGVRQFILVCGIGNDGNQQGNAPSRPSWNDTQRNNYVNDIVRAVEYIESKGYSIYAVSPFNEPDFEQTYTGNASNFNAVAAIMQTKSKLAGKVYGPSTLNSTQAGIWYSTVKNNINYANSHQLAGNNFTDWTNFWTTARNDNKTPIADEMHNMMEAMVCMNYGGKAGTWWGWNGITRGEYVHAVNEGVQLAYKEQPSKWMTASVNKYKTGNRVEAFIGSSERQAVATAFTFFSRDRLAYYDGYGPVYDYTQDMPGGANGSYQNGQTNAERLININYGEDVPIEPVNGRYKIVNKATGKVLSLTNGNATVRDNVYQWADGGLQNQAWDVIPVSTSRPDFSYVYIRNANTSTMNLYLDAQAWNMEPGANASAWSDSNTAEENDWQRWHLRYMHDGYYSIINHNTGLFLDVDNGNPANGTNVMEWTGNGGDNQLWKFVPADHAVDATAPSAPTGLSATARSASIQLQWTANTDADIYRYMVYRYNNDVNIWECIGRKVSGTSFIDNTCPKGQNLRYRIKALDKSYNLSQPSQEVTSQTTPDVALVAHWNGNSLKDASQNKLESISNGVTFATDDGHASTVFDGTDDYVELPYYVGDFHEMTFATWVKGGSNTSWQRIFDFGNGEDSYLFLTPTNGSYMRFEIKHDGTTQGLNATTTLGTGSWKHVAVTIGSSGVKIYIDGTLNASSSSITLRPDDVAPKLCYLGRSMFDADPAFKGSMSDIRLYNYELSASEVQTLANITDNSSNYEITAERIPDIADNVDNWDTHTGSWATYNTNENAENMTIPYVRTSSAGTSNLNKTLRYLPAGTYQMQANCYAYYNSSRSRNNQQIFVNNSTQTINSARNRTGTLRTLEGAVGTDWQMSFGYRTTSSSSATNLAIDNVRLFFIGTKSEYIDGLEDITYNILGDADALLNLPMNKDVKSALQTAVENITNSLDALKTSILNDSANPTITKAWTDALDEFSGTLVANAQASAAAYSTLKDAMEAAEAKADAHPQTTGGLDLFNSEMGDVENSYLMGEYLDSEIPDIIIETKRIANRYVMTDAVAQARETNAVNVTSLVLDGAGFDGDIYSPYWTASPAPGMAYGSAEFYNTNFNMYQVVYGLPAGTYRFETRGFYRYGGQDTNYSAYNNGTLQRNAKIYIEDSDGIQTADVMAISDDPSATHLWGNWSSQTYNGNPVPDNMQAASEAIDVRGKYVPRDGMNTVTISYSEGGDIIVGVRKDVAVGADWAFFGDFSLYYLGNYVTLDEMSSTIPDADNGMRSRNVSIDLTRTISSDLWNTICLPFSMDGQQVKEAFGDDVVLKELSSVETSGDNMILHFASVDAIEANKPYIMNNAMAGSKYIISGVYYTPSDDNGTTVGGLRFQGNYTYPTVLNNSGGQDYYIVNNLFKSSSGNTKIKGFRAYFKLLGSQVKSLVWNPADDDATAVDAIETDTGDFIILPADIYTVDGRLVRRNATDINGLAEGVYIIGKQKIRISK